MDVISRVDARKLGLKRFYTGKPCPHGHIAERLVSNGTCVVCTRERADAWGARVNGTVRPCKYGHISKRTTNGACMECERLGALEERKQYPHRITERNKKHYAKNPDKHRARIKVWRSENPEQAKRQTKDWQKSPKGLAWRRSRSRERYSEDIEHRLCVTLRNSVNSIINGKIKAGSAVRDLGCSPGQLREYIEQQFHSGMSWDNWGELWELDHRDPLGMFDLTNREEFLRVCNFRNLQPLLIADHWAKTELDKQRIKLARASRVLRKPEF